MCILFSYNGCYDKESDYSLIIASNRDEYFGRAAQGLAPWNEDENVYGGRDLQSGVEGGTWFGVNIAHKKIGVLLNLPENNIQDALSRGNIVTDYVRSKMSASKYFETLKPNDDKYNGFVLVTMEFGQLPPTIQTYSNKTKQLQTWTEECLGFSNSHPDKPLKKVNHGKILLKQICQKYKKRHMKAELIQEILAILKNNESQLPDTQLEHRQPDKYKELSSIFVKILGLYGTRTHTIFILTKTGHVDLIEISMESPIDAQNPTWKKTKYELDISEYLQ